MPHWSVAGLVPIPVSFIELREGVSWETPAKDQAKIFTQWFFGQIMFTSLQDYDHCHVICQLSSARGSSTKLNRSTLSKHTGHSGMDDLTFNDLSTQDAAFHYAHLDKNISSIKG